MTTQTRPPVLSYFTGLGLGRPGEFTAAAVVERSQPNGSHEAGDLTYAVRHLERFPPGTPYPAVFTRLADLFAKRPLAGSTVVADRTGVGRPVVEALRRSGVRASVREVAVAAGHAARRDDRGVWLVPRAELVSTLSVLLQSGRLRVADGLAEADTLAREMGTFRADVSTAEDDPVVWRNGAHDDLVLAVAVAAWEGERHGPVSNGVPFVFTPNSFRALG